MRPTTLILTVLLVVALGGKGWLYWRRAPAEPPRGPALLAIETHILGDARDIVTEDSGTIFATIAEAYDLARRI